MPSNRYKALHMTRRVWPQLPLALVLVAAGLLNVFHGVHAGSLLDLETLGEPVSLGALGSVAQIILGAALACSGLGLLWRARVAWSFAVMLVLVTIAVNAAQGHFGGALIVPAVLLVLLVLTHRHFARHTLFGTSLVSVISVVAVTAYGTFGIYLLGDQFEPPIKSLVTALYFVVETLSTTGYGDFSPATELAQGFMISVWLIGLSVFATAVVSVLGPALTNRMSRLFTPGGERRMHKNHVIVVGSGAIAANTAQELVDRGIDFVQIVPDNKTPPLERYPVIHGDPSDDETLLNAGVERARMLIAAHEDDGENAFISLTAKNIAPAVKVLVVASSRRAIKRLQLAQADTVFAPTEAGSRLLANLIEGHRLPTEFSDFLTQGTADTAS